MWAWLALGAVVGAILVALTFRIRRSASDTRQQLFYLADEFQRFLRRERPEIVLKRADLLVPTFFAADGRRIGWVPLVAQLDAANAVNPEDRYPIYRQWADELAAGGVPAGGGEAAHPSGPPAMASSAAPLNELETAIRSYLQQPGVEMQQSFLDCLLRSKLFVPSRRPATPGGDQPLSSLVMDTPDGPFMIAFTTPGRVSPAIASKHSIQSGLLVDATHVLRMIPDAMGLAINPGWDDLLMTLPAAGLAEFKRGRGVGQ